MGLTLTASYSHVGSSGSGQPPAKKLRLADDYLGNTVYQHRLPTPAFGNGSLLSSQESSAASRFSQSPIPLPKFSTTTLQARPSSVTTNGFISRTESRVPIPAAPSPLNRSAPPKPQLQSAPHTEQRRLSYPQVPSPATPSIGERKFSNSPIPLPSFIAPSSTRSYSSGSPVKGKSIPTASYASLPVAAHPVGNGHTARDETFKSNRLEHAPATPHRIRQKSQLSATSPQNFRTRAHALAWRKDAEVQGPTQGRPGWADLRSRPYKSAQWRQEIITDTQNLVRLEPGELEQPQVVHVDFSVKEIHTLCKLIRRSMGLGTSPTVKNPRRELSNLLKAYHAQVVGAVSRLAQEPLQGRTIDDVRNFLDDLRKEASAKKKSKVVRDPVILTLERDDYDRQGALARSARVDSLVFAREIAGQRGFGSMRRLENFNNEFRKCREDDLELRAEWVGCSGDITTISWVSDDGFICGTTEHSDPHNQQYNRPGNLVLGSCSRGTLRAYPDHRIVRPIVEKGENASEAMRESQDPWLYTSVVSSDYDESHGIAYTCGFDRTVKIWKPDMTLLGTWNHDGNVNFVVASRHESGMVTTAADVAADAVRIYHVNVSDVTRSPFRSFSCSRVVDLEGNTVSTEKWAYFPAAIQWGRCKEVQHLVAVGYSPRSRTQDDNDIPEDRRNTGELCVWDGLTGERWTIVAGSKLNMFEVLWHPTQPCFIAATSPQGKLGVELDTRIRTQIRVYTLSGDAEFHDGKAFSVHQVLDCHAADINELTIMPNSVVYCYVTAGCTDGKTYVWDTALGDNPIHVLKHGKPIDELRGDRESEDTGVKFSAWGTTPERFYTGSSDGVVKVWNIRTQGKPRSRDLLEVPAPVSFGQFSPDKSKLIIGDASGRVWFLSVDEAEQKSPPVLSLTQLGLANGNKKTRRPQFVIPHPEPDPPPGYAKEDDSGPARARAFLEKRQLVLTGHPTIGAVQGPNYAQTGFYRRELHQDDDPSKPLIASGVAGLQQEAPRFTEFNRRAQKLRPLREVQGLSQRHSANVERNFDFAQLPEDLKEELRGTNEWVPGGGIDSDCDFDFNYEVDGRDSEDEFEVDQGLEMDSE